MLRPVIKHTRSLSSWFLSYEAIPKVFRGKWILKLSPDIMWNKVPVEGKSSVDKVAAQLQHYDGEKKYKSEFGAVAVLE